MKLEAVSKIMEAVEGFCQGEKTALDIGQMLGESYESMLTLFTLTGVCDVQGYVCPGVEPWRVMGTITLMYLMRANRSLRGTLVRKRKF